MIRLGYLWGDVMSLTKDLQKKLTLAVYDHKDMTKRANQLRKSFKEIEKTLDARGKPKSDKK